MNSHLVSVIIPVFNAEQTLQRCVESILAKNSTPIEVIMVDDGSTDNSLAICNNFASADSSFKVVHKHNEGQAKARNIGLDMAKGDYVMFVDSDDSLAEGTIDYCMDLALKENADAVLFDIFRCEDSSKPLPSVTEEVITLHAPDILRFFMVESTKSSKWNSPCACLYRMGLLEGLRFREGKIHEDMDFKYKFISSCKSIVVSNQYRYFYFISGNSTTSGQLVRKNLDLRDAEQIIYKLTQQESDPTVRRMGEVLRARTPFSLLGRMARHGVKEGEMDWDTLRKELISEHRRQLPILLTAPIDWKRKLLAVLLAINYNLARFVMNKQKNIY